MIVRFLKWAVSKFESKPTPKELLTAQLFPEETPKAKPAIKKATTRPAAKKATTVAKKTTKKAK
jgi:hypothetical protein